MRTNYICFGLATAGAGLVGYKLYGLLGFAWPTLLMGAAATFFAGMLVASALFHCGKFKPVAFEHEQLLHPWLGAALRPVTLLVALGLGCAGAYAFVTLDSECPSMVQIANVNYAFRTKEALQLCDRYARFHPYDAELWAQRAYAEDILDNFDKSIADCQVSLRYDPNNVCALGTYAWALNNKGQFSEAKQYALKAVQIDPTDAYSWHAAGDAYFALKDYRPALDAYQKHAQGHPNEEAAWTRLADTYDILGMKEQAQQARDRAGKCK